MAEAAYLFERPLGHNNHLFGSVFRGPLFIILTAALLFTSGCIPIQNNFAEENDLRVQRKFAGQNALRDIELAACEEKTTQESAIRKAECINGAEERWHESVGNPYMALVYQRSAAIKLAAVDFHEGKISKERYSAMVASIRSDYDGRITDRLDNAKALLIAREDEQRRDARLEAALKRTQRQQEQQQQQLQFPNLLGAHQLRTTQPDNLIRQPTKTRCEREIGTIGAVNCTTN